MFLKLPSRCQMQLLSSPLSTSARLQQADAVCRALQGRCVLSAVAHRASLQAVSPPSTPVFMGSTLS